MKVVIGLGLVSLLAAILAVSFRTPGVRAAETAAAPAQDLSAQGQQIVSCGSDNMRRNYCPADVRAGVQLGDGCVLVV